MFTYCPKSFARKGLRAGKFPHSGLGAPFATSFEAVRSQNGARIGPRGRPITPSRARAETGPVGAFHNRAKNQPGPGRIDSSRTEDTNSSNAGAPLRTCFSTDSQPTTTPFHTLFMRTQYSILLALTLSLTACGGGGDPKEAGYAALQTGDHAAAVSAFDEALAASDSSAPDHAELQLARCEALAYVDGAKAEAEFRSLCEGGSDIGVKQYSLIAGALLAGNAMLNAVNVVDMGVNAFPDDAKMAALLEKVKEAAKEDPAALDALKGMGYLGGD